MTIILFFVYLFPTHLQADNFSQKGHIKFQSILTNYPDNSLFQDLTDDPSSDQNVDLRLNFTLRRSAWSWKADYQLLSKHGDSIALPSSSTIISQTIIDDDRRLMDLTENISERNQSVTVHRLDRLHLTYAGEQAVVRLGRQAISWGNGLVYNPMDFFNPFDPASVDKEYKTGDDMFYSQFSFDSGDDLQTVWVGRRDEEGDRSKEVTSLAAKYHVFLNDYEVDVLLSEHFDNRIFALGGVANVGGSVWRSDIVSTEIDSKWVNSAVLNISYSWLAWGKNMSGHVEFFRNGFGINNGDYGSLALTGNPELVSRIQRGELFTLGRHYLAASATLEVSPLWLLTSTLFSNLDDDSTLVQIVSQHDLLQDLQLLIAVNLPGGDEGSEYGGIDSTVPGKPLSVGESLFAQLAYYF